MEFPQERIVVVDQLEHTRRIWRDKQTFLLLGCHTDIEPNSGTYFISNTGGSSEKTTIVAVKGLFTNEEAKHRRCFALKVKYLGQEEYCFYTTYTSFNYSPFLFGGSCPGWIQRTSEFVMTEVEWKVAIQRKEMYPFEKVN